MKHKGNARGTENVLVDLGFDDADELSAKAALALKLNKLIDKRGLSQVEAAAITGMTQPKVSQVRTYKLQNISLERLMQALVSLDQSVEIVVQPAHRTRTAGITVAAGAAILGYSGPRVPIERMHGGVAMRKASRRARG